MTRHHQRLARAAGFSLIELLVSMAIGLVVTIAIATVMINTEGSKRSTTSVNDLSETGTYIGYVLDRAVRNGGSGYSQNVTDAYGCKLDASYGGAALLPMTTAAAAPFANVPTTFRLAPVLIGKNLATDTGGQTHGDVIITMAGSAGIGETPQAVSTVTATNLAVTNGLGYNTAAGNVILLADPTVTSGCMVQQLQIGTSPLAFATAGNYYKAAGNTGNIAAFGKSTVAIQLGGDGGVAPDTANPPQFQMFGVGDNNTLWTHNLLKVADTTNPAQVADGIVEMHALYGVDVNTGTATGKFDHWVDPSTAPYTLALLTNGTTTAQANLHKILAVRIGLVLRTSLPEKSPVLPAGNNTLTLFTGLTDDTGTSLQQTYTISTANSYYRFRTVEITVPLRNLYF